MKAFIFFLTMCLFAIYGIWCVVESYIDNVFLDIVVTAAIFGAIFHEIKYGMKIIVPQ